MDLAPSPLRRAVTPRPNALRITRAQKAIAAAMHGVDPDAEDLAGLAEIRVDEQTLHLSTVAALRQILMSRPAIGVPRSSRRRRAGGTRQQVVRNAYYLALALADCAGAEPALLERALSGVCADWLEPAALVGRLQVRFLEQVCSQIDMTAHHLPVPPWLSRVTSREILAGGGQLAPGIVLLADHTFDERDRRDGHGAWLHATSTVVVVDLPGPVVVDAGPDTLIGAWSARVAAPVTVTAAAGRWPVTAVEDCLRMCAGPVRWWVASMTRQLSGHDDEDLLLRSGAPLRQFLVSPASTAIAAALGASVDGALHVCGYGPEAVTADAPTAAPLLAAGRGDEQQRHPQAAILLPIMRAGGEPGTELAPDIVLDGCVQIAEIHADEMTLLSASDPQDLGRDVEVTVNFATSEWQDVTALVEDIRAAGAVQLSAPVLGWADQDTVIGAGHRLSLRARVSTGVPVHTRDGYAVLLGAGTRLTLLGADVSKRHTTLYATEYVAAAPANENSADDEQECNAA